MSLTLGKSITQWAHFVDTMGLVHRGEAPALPRHNYSGWAWFPCGRRTAGAVLTDANVSCMHCAADIPFVDWKNT